MEILAPVGNRENLVAAVQAGAHAIYLGGDLFSARAYAGNFSKEELGEAIDYAHGYGVRVYLTVNTLLKEGEIAGAVDYIRWAWNRGVDAVIFQDPGLLYLVKKLYPDIELHASTQISVHNRPMAEYFKEKGVERLILARELSLKEIAGIRGVLDLEVFVQGALCICYSGQCLMSSLIGGRSGNRGRCAQPCRLEYSLYKGDDFVKKGRLISPKELSLLDELDSLKEAGVVSLKIEGRMRSPDYVYEAVSAYKKKLNGQQYDARALELSFSRQGFTKAYLHKKGGDQLISEVSGKSGLELGSIKNGKLRLEADLNRLDGLATPRGGFKVEHILVEGQKVDRALEGQVVEILPRKYKEGDQIRKTLDVGAQTRIKEVLRDDFARKEEVEVDFSFELGRPMKLGSLEGRLVEEARTAPLSKERIIEALSKSQGPLVLKPRILTYEEGFVPIAALNELRRNYLDELLEARKVRRELEARELPPPLDRKLEASKYVIIRRKDQLGLDFKGMELVVDPFFKDPGSLGFEDLKGLRDYYVRVPGIVKENLEGLAQKLMELEGLKGVLTSNQGIYQLLKGRTRLIGDYKLNIMNSYGASLYQELDGFIVSEELNKSELEGFRAKDQSLVYIYGPQEMMVMEYCPLRDGDPCSEPCRLDEYSLRDRKDYKLLLGHDIYCRSRIYNGPRKDLLGEMDQLRDMGFGSFIMELLDEDQPQRILDAFSSEEGLALEMTTRGHYNRGVE